MSEQPEAGTHGYRGSYLPKEGCTPNHATFSLGVFEWVLAKSGGVKRSAVKVRVRGLCRNADAVEAEAARVAAELDNGTYSGPKRVTVGTI